MFASWEAKMGAGAGPETASITVRTALEFTQNMTFLRKFLEHKNSGVYTTASFSFQMKQRNGVVKPTLPKSWSPKHLNSYDILNAEAELNDTLSSDSDSDID
jgi:hypothetical protein